jgi:hypothetical protein
MMTVMKLYLEARGDMGMRSALIVSNSSIQEFRGRLESATAAKKWATWAKFVLSHPKRETGVRRQTEGHTRVFQLLKQTITLSLSSSLSLFYFLLSLSFVQGIQEGSSHQPWFYCNNSNFSEALSKRERIKRINKVKELNTWIKIELGPKKPNR